MNNHSAHDAVIVGAGFSGLYMLRRLRDDLGLDVVVVDKAPEVGGTWYWNKYPGLRCDVESMLYSFSFDEDLQREWSWKERYAPQQEILEYAKHVADRFDLRKSIRFETEVTAAVFERSTARWEIQTDQGALSARYLITAVGCLSIPYTPDFPGLGNFKGRVIHTGTWPEAISMEGRKVAVIGTGSTAVQVMPEMAKVAEQVTLFQRTPTYVIPARNRMLNDGERQFVKDNYEQWRRAERLSSGGQVEGAGSGKIREHSWIEVITELESRWLSGGGSFQAGFTDVTTDQEANRVMSEFVKRKIREGVNSKEYGEILSEIPYPFGAKRVALMGDYLEAFNQDNVLLVSLRDQPIAEITDRAIVVGDCSYEVDDIVMATGFDAITGGIKQLGIVGEDGVALAEKWGEGPLTYLGLTTSGFPNLFMLLGPGSPSVLTNMMAAIEQHVEWVSDFIRFLEERGGAIVDVPADTEQAWTEEVDRLGAASLFAEAGSWYRGSNIPGKAQRFMPYSGGLDSYRTICDEVAANGYDVFEISK